MTEDTTKCSGNVSPKSARTAALRSYGLLGKQAQNDFADVARIAAEACGTPIAIVAFAEADRLRFVAEVGLAVKSIPLLPEIEEVFLPDDVLVVRDTSKDSRFVRNPVEEFEPGLLSYAAAPLTSGDGIRVGSLCVFDYGCRDFSSSQRGLLQFLSKQVMLQLELRRTIDDQRGLLSRARNAELQRTRFERLVSQSSDFMGATDANGRVAYLNEAAREMV
ncbi:GAF domain-containing protein [Agrobacterium pusense]|uniref:GAF domain-containing protein n=1 Tax=Agrobacterium pusense TaxID=648995 RepID=UPI001AE6F8DD|nr:GAF domain-containing protein [Agrobacterium pusense]MBP2611450.1 GAF domain-containing protein [Agrobacterium pusense]